MRLKDMNFDLKQLRSYLEVLDQNSFTKASRNLKIGQATISHHISQLEKSIGARLIIRTSKEFSVTREGEVFRGFCEQVFQNVESLRQEIGRGDTGGLTRISASTIPATYILPRIIASVREKNPDYYYRMDTSDSREVIEMVKDRTAEIGITGRIIRNRTLEFMEIGSDSVVLIGGRDSPVSVSISDIPMLPLVSREPGSGTREACEQELNRHGIRPSDLDIVFECSSTETVRESVEAGQGYAFISDMAIGKSRHGKGLKVIDVEGFEIMRKFYLVHLKSRYLSGPARAIIEALTQQP